MYKKYTVENIKCFKLGAAHYFMNYDIKINPRDRPKVPKNHSPMEYVLAGLGAIAITCAAVASFSYFYPMQFNERKGDHHFSTSTDDGYWEGYVRCEDRNEKIIVIENSAGKLVSLEEALSNVPKELGRREIAREEILERVDKFCSN